MLTTKENFFFWILALSIRQHDRRISFSGVNRFCFSRNLYLRSSCRKLRLLDEIENSSLLPFSDQIVDRQVFPCTEFFFFNFFSDTAFAIEIEKKMGRKSPDCTDQGCLFKKGTKNFHSLSNFSVENYSFNSIWTTWSFITSIQCFPPFATDNWSAMMAISCIFIWLL